ncbi:MAG: DinB family protein [Saprospirales bacterium]|nr:DinB family protein [Saprospirales bacterium]MBK8490036.1 DinB family protein [Saprospirales bacterium]
MKIPRPYSSEYAPYYQYYLDLVPEGDVLRMLNLQKIGFSEFLYSIPDERWTHRYAPGKFSVAEVLSHIIDAERIFAYRALCFARNDKTDLPGFEQDDYALVSGADNRSKASIETEYLTVRNATIELFRTFDETTLSRVGIANTFEMSVRAIPFLLVGHELHHLQIIKDRYLKGVIAESSELPWRFSMARAVKELEKQANRSPFVQLMNEQEFTVEWYAPQGVDSQTPHLEDELYIVASGSGTFENGGQSVPFSAGDVLFVPAGQEHRFINFSDDFATWVVFFK